MAEGDTIHRLARVLSEEIVGGRVERLWLRDRGAVETLRGATVREVSALGKHLLMLFEAGRRGKSAVAEEWVLHTHLGMPGRWRRTRQRAVSPWREREPPAVMLELGAEAVAWVCTQAARCELFPRFALRDHPRIRALGPDLLAPPLPIAAVLRRARVSPASTLADLLLDQRVACGLGNVYKSELLFLHRYPPHQPAGALGDDEIEALYRDGAALLAANLGPGRRRTRAFEPRRASEPRFWVYDRAGRPCLRCATPICVEHIGEHARVTYWCPTCQTETPLRRSSARGTDIGEIHGVDPDSPLATRPRPTLPNGSTKQELS